MAAIVAVLYCGEDVVCVVGFQVVVGCRDAGPVAVG